jgi:ABC-type sugar transport system permease subunit
MRAVIVPRRKPYPWAVSAAVAAVFVLSLLAPALAVLIALAAAWGLWKPTVEVHGGRRPLSTAEWIEWNAHLALSAEEQERARKEAERRK